MGDSNEPDPKRVKTDADVSNGFFLGDQRVLLGSKDLLKRSEFIKLMVEALMSLGYHDVATILEERSGIRIQNSMTKEFLELVNKGEWDKSIDALQGLELKDDSTVKFCLLEQKFFDLLKKDEYHDAMSILKDKMAPLGVSMKCLEQLSTKLIIPTGEDTEVVDSRSKVVEKLRKLLPLEVMIPERRLEYLLEDKLDRQVGICKFHNIPDSDLSLCCDHHCLGDKIPSATLQTLEEHTDEVWYLEFSHNGKYLASSSKDQSAIIWEMKAEKKFWRKHKLVGHKKAVVMVLWSPDDRQVITCGEEEAIRRWDAETGQCVHVYKRNGLGSVSCGWFHDGSGIIGAMADRRICLWNLDGSEIEHEQKRREQKQSDVAMTNDGKWIISMSKEREISFFDRETKTVDRYKVIREEDPITSFALSKDNKYMLNNHSTEEITIWFIETDEPYKHYEYTGHKSRRFIIRSCFGGYKDTFVASGSEDSQVYIWHRDESENPLGVLKGHTKSVKCVSWNPSDIYMLASASDDGTIRIWGRDKRLEGADDSDIIRFFLLEGI